MGRTCSNAGGAYVDCGDISAMDGASALTWSFWGSRSSTSVRVTIAKYSDATNRTSCDWFTDGNLYCVLSGTQYGYVALAGTGMHHFCMRFDGSASGNAKLRAWVDGVEQSLSYAGTLPATTSSTSAPFTIGREAGGSDGTFWEVGAWSVALTPDEIVALSKRFSPACIQCGSLIDYWPLIGRASPEPGIKGNLGTLVNAPTVADHIAMIRRRPVQRSWDNTTAAPPATSVPLMYHHYHQHQAA